MGSAGAQIKAPVVNKSEVVKKFLEYCKSNDIDYVNKKWIVLKEKVTENFLLNLINSQFVAANPSISSVELLEEFKNSKFNKANGKVNGVQYQLNNYKRTYPIITNLNENWNHVDDVFMENFYYSFDASGSSIVWFLRNQKSSTYTAIYPAQCEKTERAQIISACSKVKTVNRVTKAEDTHANSLEDLFAHLVSSFEKTALKIFDISGSKEKCEDRVRKLMKETLPLFAVNNSMKLCVIVHEKTENFEGVDVPVAYVKDLSFENTTSSPNSRASVWDYLHIAMKNIQTRKDKSIQFPKVYSTVPGVPTMRYLNLEKLGVAGECPNWDFFLKRFTEPEQKAFMAFIYSIFDSENTGRQCLYICDRGFTGKSVITNVIAEYLGQDLVASIQKNSLDNNFGLAKVWDKRLVVIDDNKNKNIIRSEKIHMLLGQGLADVEYKRRDAFMAKLQSKLIICGNTYPSINPYATHELTRLILVEPQLNEEILKQIAKKDADGNVIYDSRGKPVYQGDSEFPKKLKQEFPQFLYKCKAQYEELCPSKSNIVIGKEMIERLYDMESITESEFERIFLDNYCPDKDGFISKSDLFAWYVAVINDGKDKENEFDNFTSFLYKRFDIQFRRTRVNGDRQRNVCTGWSERGSASKKAQSTTEYENILEGV